MKIRKILLYVILIISFLVGTAATVATEVYVTQKKLDENIKTWIVELTSAIVSKDTFLQRRYEKSFSILTGYAAFILSDPLKSSSFLTPKCFYSIYRELSLVNYPVGSINLCIDSPTLVKRSLKSPVLLMTILLLVLLVSGAYIVPLLHHKNSFLKLVKSLEHTANYHQLPEPDQADDMLTKKITEIISRVVKSEKELITTNMENQNLRDLSDFAKHVAHDIRAPLSALQTAVFCLATQSDNNVNEEVIELLRKSSMRINDIALDLLRFDKNKKNFSDALAEIDIKSIAHEIIKEKSVLLKQRNIGIKVSSPAEPVLVMGRSSDFSRVISNLLSNSIEAITQNSGEIQIIINQHKDLASLSIVDNGIGISEPILDELRQAPKSFGKEDHENSGFGIGLKSASSIIHSWGGKLGIDSSLGEGTTISLILPSKQV
jgi:signal transduction histidine kinase